MLHTFARTVLASAIALGTLVFTAGSAVPGEYNQYQNAYPYARQVMPIVVPDTARNSRTIVIVQQPQILTPADLRFSVEKEGDVTVVRGPIAR